MPSHVSAFTIGHDVSAFTIGNTITETWRGSLLSGHIGPWKNLTFMCFLWRFFSILYQQHFSVILGLLQ